MARLGAAGARVAGRAAAALARQHAPRRRQAHALRALRLLHRESNSAHSTVHSTRLRERVFFDKATLPSSDPRSVEFSVN